jgi:NAD dependent epimerase/dehydratase family enzyme
MMMGEGTEEMLLASERAVPARLSAAGFEFAHPTVDKALGAMLARR